MKIAEPGQTNEMILDLARKLIVAWNDHDFDQLLTFYAPDYEGIDVGEAGPHYGPAGIRQNLARYLEAFPDLHFVTDSPIVQHDRLALAWTARGTHLGKLMNIPPTGHRVEVRGVSLLAIKDNKISRGFYIWDVAGLLRSIGLLPEL
ncbi:MAG: ester cyclase [Chloroflexota bacterium]